MAQKRMFDKGLLETDDFMDMPMSTKALYFLLGMEADDEGFVSPKRVFRLYGGTEDDLKVLYNVVGFHSLLYYLGKPAKVRAYEIQNLRILLQENLEFEKEDYLDFQQGDKVEVIRGPFQGLIATSLEVSRTHKLIVEIESIEQRFVVHVPKSYVRKIK
jgi:hypothetical protein